MQNSYRIISLILLLVLVHTAGVCHAGGNGAWSLFKKRFIQDDGRVIDRMNQDFTHSEAVGYTLFFALSYDDQETFNKVHRWMTNNLKKNEYGLYGWKWGKAASGKWRMLDMNNASDGDMWIAASLLLAHKKYAKQEYLEDGLALLKAIRDNLIITADDGISYLLPARDGFIKGKTLTLNPSYLILHLFKQFGDYDSGKKTVWLKLYDDAKKVLIKSRFGCFQIHPDWVEVDMHSGAVSLNEEKTLFSYDAIRVPLFVSYAGKIYDDPELETVLVGYYKLNKVYELIGNVTQPVDLKDVNMSLQPASFGFRAVFSCLTKGMCRQGDAGWPSLRELENAKKNYYSFSLLLFADILFI